MSRRVAHLSVRLDPAPDPLFLAYARAVIAWGGGEPTEELALALARTGRGLPWTTLVALAEDSEAAR